MQQLVVAGPLGHADNGDTCRGQSIDSVSIKPAQLGIDERSHCLTGSCDGHKLHHIHAPAHDLKVAAAGGQFCDQIGFPLRAIGGRQYRSGHRDAVAQLPTDGSSRF